jgi:hypothetical protein
MELNDMLSNGFAGILRVLEYTLEGLTPEDINWQPKPDCNSVGWLAWHPTRWQDQQISAFMGEEQLWIKDKWYQKFGRAADPKDSGGRMTPADLAKFKVPDAKTMLDYHRAVLARSQKYIAGLKKEELDKIVEGTPFPKPPTRGALLLMVMSDGLQHAGQAAYVRGMRQGMGWH